MILHSSGMLAFLLEKPAQTPAQLQCLLQTPSDPWWKWLLQLVLSIVPVAGGVWIAMWSFRATSRRDHEQWLADNKKGEWRKLISLAAQIEYHMPSVAIGGDLVKAVKGNELEEHLRLFTQAALECVFAGSVLGEGGLYEKLVDLREAKEQAILEMGIYEESPTVAYSQGRPSPVEVARNFQAQFASIFRSVHHLARKDLDMS
jgi:hypothetical protein